MRKRNGQLLYAPTDLARFLASPYACWMDRYALEIPDAPEPDPPEEIETILAAKGYAHEAQVRRRLEAEGRTVVAIEDGPDAVAATRRTLEEGADVVFQARLEAPPFAGVADFLVRVEGGGDVPRYEVWDAKLARTPRPEHLVQLCAYADLLARTTGTRPSHLGLFLGDGSRARFRCDDAWFHYLRLKAAFLAAMEGFDPEAEPLPDAGADHGRWSGRAEAVLEARDHLCRVAGIRTSQIRKLEKAGITTLTALATTTKRRVPKLDSGMFERLRAQARLQRASADEARPRYEILTPDPDDPRRGLALLPPASPLDVFFDIEGYPLLENGLEYLFGATWLEDGAPRFRDGWAFDADGEKRAFEDFVDWVMARHRADPAMHVYHYAPYEPAALKRLMGRYATREEEVDHLLRAHVFVDLYRVVQQGMCVGAPSYSLKKIERLYMDREAEVATAMDSVVYFDRWLELGDPPSWEASAPLRAIRDYNREDCESTWKLAGWLRERQAEAGIAYLPEARVREEPEAAPLEGEAGERQRLVEALLAGLRDLDPDDAAYRIQELLAYLLEFHRREEKPLWWSFFERHAMTPDQLVDDPTCIGKATRVGEPEPARRSMGFRYRFDADQDTKIRPGCKVAVAGWLEVAPLTVETIDASGELMVVATPAKLQAFPDGEPPREASFLLHERVGATEIVRSIQAVAQAWAAGEGIPPCLENFLLRQPPRGAGARGRPLLGPGEDLLAGTTRVVRALDQGALLVQGPPGTGKTFVGGHVIADLLRRGKNVGVVSNSHEAVLNLMDATGRAYGEGFACLKVGGEGDHAFFDAHPGARHAAGGQRGEEAYAGGLVGGTAWFFVRAGMRGALDVLFVDEAGQVSLANLVGMAPSTRSLVLLGDQMQLAQPIQGTHPGESGQSALEYALAGHATVPPDLGVFLDTTWRLHPEICAFVSGAVYEDRLRPEPHTVHRRIRLPADGGTLVPKEEGILFSAVEHEGNTQASDEEVARVVAIVDELLGRTRTDRDGKPAGQVGLDDILFIAPYNMQVRRLADRLPAGARVASVDKFQGQEAPIVIVSLCASPGEAGPRGLGFVLDKNRLNVAVSRAQSLAIVVGDPRLALAPVTSIADLERQNLLCRLLEASGS